MAERDRETVVVTDGGGGGSSGLIAVVLLIAIVVVLFVLFGGDLLNGSAAPTDLKADIDVNLPSTGGSAK